MYIKPDFRIGKYRIDAQLGEGGFAKIYSSIRLYLDEKRERKNASTGR
jgi:hypothetical protein